MPDDSCRPAGDDTGGADTDDTGTVDCLDATARDRLGRFAYDLAASTSWIAGHAGPQESTGFLVLPEHVPVGPTWATLTMECAGASEYDPYCSDGICSQIVCNADAPSWTMRFSLDGEGQTDDSPLYTAAEADFTWPGAGDVLAMTQTGTGADASGVDWSHDGTLDYADMAFAASFTFPGLSESGDTTLAMDVDLQTEAVSGTVTIGDEIVGTLVAEGDTFRVEPAGACAER